jgi:hypothetical protein
MVSEPRPRKTNTAQCHLQVETEKVEFIEVLHKRVTTRD